MKNDVDFFSDFDPWGDDRRGGDGRYDERYGDRGDGRYDERYDNRYDTGAGYDDRQDDGWHRGGPAPRRGGGGPPRRRGGGGPPPRRDGKAYRRQQKRRRRKGRAAFLFALAFLVAVLGTGGVFGAGWVEKRLRPQDYSGAGTGSVTVQIKEGDSGGNIAQTLVRHGVVKGTEAFVAELARNPKAAGIQPGFYQMRKQMSSAAAVALLLDPRSRAGNLITIPEGLRAVQIAVRLAQKTGIDKGEFEKVMKNPRNLGLPRYAKGKVEGFLFPGQYNLPPKGTPEQILKMMVDRYHQFARQLDLEARAREAGLRPLSVIIMASLIQAESGRPEDMPKISRVIYNRLRRDPPMFLKFDSTTLYGLNKFGIVASSQQIRSKSRYNTYNYPGLPIGAISNPGQQAIDAVFRPADGTWLFFVTTDPKNKITKYATSEAEFSRYRAELNRYLARQGGN